MGYEKLPDLSTETVVKIGGDKPNPTELEGFYLGSRTVTTQNGPAVIHVFQTPKGNIGAWGTADLNSKLGSVALGTQTLVEYKGKKKLAGGKTKHSYDVSVDNDQRIDVPKGAAQASADYAEDEEVPAEDDFAPPTLSAADRLAKIQATLRSKNK